MSDQNGDRATVALVLSELKGLRDFTDARLTDVQRQLDGLTGLPVIVNGLLERVRQHDEELEQIRKQEEKRREYRIGPLPLILIGFASVVIAFVALLVAMGVHHG